MARLDAGSRAPAFTLANQNGDKIALSSFRGERVVLYFYPADDTPGCTKEACQFNDDLLAFKRLGVKVIGISPNSPEDHVSFQKKYGLKVDLLCDPDKKVMAKYGAYGEKMLYGKKVQGVIRSTFVIGTNARIEHAWYGVHADGHASRVLAALRD